MLNPTVNILILNFNGKDLLEKFLPSFETAVRRSRFSCVLSVLDNNSADGSAEFIGRHFPGVVVHRIKKNKVLCSYNEVAQKLEEDILILMNNDCMVHEDFIGPLVEPFRKEADLFLTQPAFYNADGSMVECANAVGGIRWGLFWAKTARCSPGVTKPTITLSAGMGAVDRKKFLMLGGYDPLYLPGTLEDVDLCFRAWRRGWRSVYISESKINHMGQVSFKKEFGVSGLRVINFRNIYLFMWKNIRDPFYLLEHVIFLLPRILCAFLKGRPELGIGLIKALGLLPRAVRSHEASRPIFKERQIFEWFREK